MIENGITQLQLNIALIFFGISISVIFLIDVTKSRHGQMQHLKHYLTYIHDASKGNIEGYKVLRDIVFFEII